MTIFPVAPFARAPENRGQPTHPVFAFCAELP